MKTTQVRVDVRSHNRHASPSLNDPRCRLAVVCGPPHPTCTRNPVDAPLQLSDRTLAGPRSRNTRRITTNPGVAIATQIAMRAGNGRSTRTRMSPQSSTSQPTAARAALRDGTSSICPQDGAAQGREVLFRGDVTGNQIAGQVRIGQFEKFPECRAFIARRRRVLLAQVSQQQQIELLHAAAAAPLQPPDFSAGVQPSSF